MKTCAICTAEVPTKPTLLDGVVFNVCGRCNDEHPRYGGYSFGESVRDGVQSHLAANSVGGIGNSSGRQARRKSR